MMLRYFHIALFNLFLIDIASFDLHYFNFALCDIALFWYYTTILVWLYVMSHYLMLYYFNFPLFDNALVAIVLDPVSLVTVARLNVAVFWYCTIWCWFILILHFSMLHNVNNALVVVSLFNVTLFDLALFNVALFNIALFTVVLFNVALSKCTAIDVAL